MHDKIQVVLACDENYAQHCGVMMTSILANKQSSVPIKITVLHGGISVDSQQKLRNIAILFKAEIELMDMSSQKFDALPVHHHFTKAIYFRLNIADLHPDQPDKIIYLDVDVLVRHDITELWEVDISKYHLAAVVDIGISSCKNSSYRNKLGILSDETYFNSGVMLINAREWRKDSIGDQAIQFVLDKKESGFVLKYPDQDALNVLLKGKWKELHPKWNVAKAMFHRYYNWNGASLLDFFTPETLRAIKDPYIVHFTGSAKSWHYACGLPYAEKYYQYLKLTDWKAYRPDDIGIRSAARRYTWFIKRYIFDWFRR